MSFCPLFCCDLKQTQIFFFFPLFGTSLRVGLSSRQKCLQGVILSLHQQRTVTQNCAHQMETAPRFDSLIYWSGVIVRKLLLFSPRPLGFGHKYRSGRGVKVRASLPRQPTLRCLKTPLFLCHHNSNFVLFSRGGGSSPADIPDKC